MFNQPEEKNTPPATGPASSGNHEVYIMPEKFQAEKSSSLSKSLIIVVIILVAVIIITAGYFIYEKMSSRPVAPQNNQLSLSPITSPENTIDDIGSVTSTTATSTNGLSGQEASTTPTSTADVINQNLLNDLPPAFSSDADADGLSDVEENLVGSSSAKPDTDGDGYIDGQEIQNGYSPIIAGAELGKLLLANFLETVKTNFTDNNFQLYYLKGWAATAVPASRQVIITTGTGEIIRVSQKLKDTSVSAAGWYLQNNPGVSLAQLRIVTAGTAQGVFSPNGLHAYIADNNDNNLYVFDYIVENGVEFRYPTLFTMIIKSLTKLPDVPVNNVVATTTSSTADVIAPVTTSTGNE